MDGIAREVTTVAGVTWPKAGEADTISRTGVAGVTGQLEKYRTSAGTQFGV